MELEVIEIVKCACCHPVDRNEQKYQTDIICTSCTWRESLEVEYTLQDSPVIGQTYNVTLGAPVKFWVNMDLWLHYDCPLAFYNGYESELQIEESKFCYGRITNLISQNELGATIEFKVQQTTDFHNIVRNKSKIELPETWTNFFMAFIEKNDFQLYQYGKYYELTASSQGDVGQSCVFTQFGDRYVICKMEEWSLSEECTYGGSYLLPRKIENSILK